MALSRVLCLENVRMFVSRAVVDAAMVDAFLDALPAAGAAAVATVCAATVEDAPAALRFFDAAAGPVLLGVESFVPDPFVTMLPVLATAPPESCARWVSDVLWAARARSFAACFFLVVADVEVYSKSISWSSA